MGARVWRHLLMPPGRLARAFPPAVLADIEGAIGESEQRHHAEIRFAVEAALDPLPLLSGLTARERALQAFAELRVWDTEQNNGVLLYLLLADRDVEIVADRGYNGKVSAGDWEEVCRAMEAQLALGHYREAVLEGVGRCGALAALHFPAAGDAAQRPGLSDQPVVL